MPDSLLKKSGVKAPPLPLAGLVFIATFLMALSTGSRMLGIDSDLGRHLAIGKFILDQRTIPTQDVFSHTLTGNSRPPYEWLSQVGFALAHRLLGMDGVIVLTASLIGITFLVLFLQSGRRSRSPLVSLAVVLLAAAAASIHWLPRPHLVTILLMGIWIEDLEQLTHGEERRVYAFPIIMILWANLHGGFIFGFLAWVAYLAGWFWQKLWRKQTSQEGGKLLPAGILSLAASLITPDLWRNWEAVLNNRSSSILSRTAETMPPALTDPAILPFTFLMLLTFLLFVSNRKSLHASHVFLLTGLGFMSILMARNIPLFAVASAPVLSELLQKSLVRFHAWRRFEQRFSGFTARDRSSGAVFIAICITAVLFAVYQSRSGKSYFQFNPHVFPVQAVDWLEANPQQGNMFNDFNWGGYILHRLWPGREVFLDSQSDFYGEPLVREYETILLAQDRWRDLIVKYRVEWAIIPPNSPLVNELISDGWTAVYEDGIAVVIAKK